MAAEPHSAAKSVPLASNHVIAVIEGLPGILWRSSRNVCRKGSMLEAPRRAVYPNGVAVFFV